jgi:hypothetical protein
MPTGKGVRAWKVEGQGGVQAPARVAFPLTPILSLGEREQARPALGKPERFGLVDRQAKVPPLPKGEDWGEGERALRAQPALRRVEDSPNEQRGWAHLAPPSFDREAIRMHGCKRI